VSDRASSRAIDDAIAYRIHRTNRLLRTHLSRFLDEHADGISPEQYFVLARLHEREPRRQTEFAEPVLGDPPNVTRLVDGLVDRGLIERRRDETDRRSWAVHLTGEGRALMRRLHTATVAERRALFGDFTDPEVEAVVRFLDRLDDRLRALLS